MWTPFISLLTARHSRWKRPLAPRDYKSQPLDSSIFSFLLCSPPRAQPTVFPVLYPAIRTEPLFCFLLHRLLTAKLVRSASWGTSIFREVISGCECHTCKWFPPDPWCCCHPPCPVTAARILLAAAATAYAFMLLLPSTLPPL